MSENKEIRRIVVLGKTGAGKSSLANTIFEEKVFKIDSSANSGTSQCQAKTKCVNGKWIQWIDTPGIFDTGRKEEELKGEILKCIMECAPGPHVFLIVLKVEKFTKQEQSIIDTLLQYFSEKALTYAAVVFTHGDQLEDGVKIEEFVNQSNKLKELLEKCGNRCHVFDNKYWKKSEQDEYKSNPFHVAELLKTIDKITDDNTGGYFTSEMLQEVETEKQQEEERIRQSSANSSPLEITNKAKTRVLEKQLLKAAGVTAGALLGAFLGGGMKLMAEEMSMIPKPVLALGVAIGAAAGIAAGKEATGEASAATKTEKEQQE